MKILTVDIGTGTQDIYLYDSRLDIENGFKLVLPSPTMNVHHQLKQATRDKKAVVLSGVMMGGGPSAWAAEEHARAGLPTYATPEAARTLNDDLSAVEAQGIRLIGEDEVNRLPGHVVKVAMRDFDFSAIHRVFSAFGVSLDDLDGVAVAVFDHGNAPVDVSDRQFRFDYLDARIRAANRLSAFAYRSDQIPTIMTRLLAVAHSAEDVEAPLVVMDTAPAAVLGATFDPRVSTRQPVMIANIGNFHTLAFRLGLGGIEGVFEHHTGELDRAALESYLRRLADGSLKHEDVFRDMGHGALLYDQSPMGTNGQGPGLVVTGPRRGLMRGSQLEPYFAVPFGDMMIAGCFGLLAATADVLPEFAGPIRASLSGAGGAGTPPWEIDN
jgi:uncharacterized protein (DUF1786 family)